MKSNSIKLRFGWRASRLHNKHIATAHVFIQLNGYFAIRKSPNHRVAKPHSETLCNALCQFWVGVAGKNHEVGHRRRSGF
jgi:hypothetical protein